MDGHRGRQLSLDYGSHKKLEAHLRTEIIEHVSRWLCQDDHSPYNYKAVDAVFRLAGAGSVGINRYAVLLESLNKKGEKYLLLDMKQARQSSVLPYTANLQPQWKHEADRVVSIEQRMQNRSPALLSTTVFRGDAYVIEEMQSAEDKIDFRWLKNDYREMCRVIAEMGALTAAAHLRSSGRQGASVADELTAFGQEPQWKQAIVQHAAQYARQVNNYYLQFTGDHAAAAFKKQGQSKSTFANTEI